MLEGLSSKPICRGKNAEVIGAEAAAVFLSELSFEDPGKPPQKIISLRKAEPAVIVLHTAQVDIHDRRVAVAAPVIAPPLVDEIDEIRHRGQSREHVIAAVISAFLPFIA